MTESDNEASYAVVWEKCYHGNVDGEQIVWVCKTREQAKAVAAFLATANPHLHTIDPKAPRYMQFITRPAKAAEVAGCACLIKRLRELDPRADDDALKLSRLVLNNHALLGIELLQDGYIAQFTSPAQTSPRGVSSAPGWQGVLLQKLDIMAANTSHLAKISEATQGTQENTFRMAAKADEPAGKRVVAQADAAYMSAGEVAKAIGAEAQTGAIRMALQRMRDAKQLPDAAWMENAEPQRGQATTLYRLDLVRPLLSRFSRG